MKSKDLVGNLPWLCGCMQFLGDPIQAKRLRQIVAGIPHNALLELGCGTGRMSGITDRPYVGVDINPDYIRYANRRHGSPARRFVTGSIFDLPDSLGKFDLVALINVLHHLPDPDVRRMLSALPRVSPRHLLVVDHDPASERGLIRVFRWLDRGGHFRTLEQQSWLFKESGWSTAMARTTDRPFRHSETMLLASPPGGG